MVDNEDTLPSSARSIFDADEIDKTQDEVLLHIVGEAMAAVVKLTDIMSDAKDLLSQLTHLAEDIRAVRALHKSSMLPNARTSIPDVE